MAVEWRELFIPKKYRDRTGVERTSWRSVGMVGVDWDAGKVKMQLSTWPDDLWAMGFEPKGRSRGAQEREPYHGPQPENEPPDTPEDTPPF